MIIFDLALLREQTKMHDETGVIKSQIFKLILETCMLAGDWGPSHLTAVPI